ncbi:MAG: sugar ABC transporter substrate-binding protein [Alkaliphilus sp.]|jgi:raffinose/stachyose/melibiose transport system substrate-binding protein|nr:MAG: sugar ABC transporter substrate-binding protein [Alkaliphilus sp.]
MFKTSKRRFVSFALVLILSAALFAGCAKDDDVVSTEPVEIEIFQFKVEMAQDLEAAAREFEKAFPNVTVVIQTVGGGDDYGAALRAKFASGEEPVIFNIGGPQDVEDWKHKVADLSDEAWVELAHPGILSGVTVGNEIFGLPFNIEGYGFVYNKSILADAGIDASKIVNFKSLEAAVKQLDAKIKAGDLKNKYPNLEAVFDLPAKETWVTGLHTSNAIISQEFASSIEAFEASDVKFTYGDALKALIDLQANFSPHADNKSRLNAVDYSTQVDMGLAIERVAIIQQGNWVFGGVNAIDENVAANLSFLPFPVKGAVEDSIPVGVPMHWAVNKDSDPAQVEAAKNFLNWLYTSDTGKDFIVNKFFFIPPLKGYDDFPPADPLAKSIIEFAEAGRTMPWVFMGYPSGWGMEILGNEIQKYLADEVSWDEVIKTSIDKWEEMRK